MGIRAKRKSQNKEADEQIDNKKKEEEESSEK
jgi:hypothetical protein